MKDRRIAIVGMARSGLAAARLCLREGGTIFCLDLERPPRSEEAIASLEALGATCLWGPHPIGLLEKIDRVVKSPGVPGEIGFLRAARARRIPIWSEVELASRYARGPILAITGTNGKSTTTAWAADMLTRCGRPAEPTGNIGRPFSDAVLTAGEGTTLVAEISSFQLEEIDTFRPLGAALLNLTPDHLDRHPDFPAYREAKMRIFMNQGAEEHAVLGEQDDLAEEAQRRYRPRILRFRLEDRGEEGAFLDRARLVERYRGADRSLCAATELALPGRHNQANALAAVALLAPLRLPEEGLVASLRGFPGLPHRLERIAEVAGVAYVNDSKATNTDSLAIALEAFDAPLVLLAGGRGKGQDFRLVAEPVRRRCRGVILFGESAESIREAWGSGLCETVGDLAEAVARARRLARPGEIVLLSPACASFDQFRDYEDRGERFREIVSRLEDSEEER